MAEPQSDPALREQADLILVGEALGRSPALERLLRFLLACALDGRAPKEIEIADEVFGRSADSVDSDASVRVHIHRLRRKLDEFYAGAGAAQPVRLALPKGGYRLIVEPMAERPGPVDIVAPRRAGLPWLVVALLMVAVAGVTWLVTRRGGDADRSIAALRAGPLWQPLGQNGRRIAIVAGDYYIFGERNAEGDVARLVREFAVNSPADLERFASAHPDRAASAIDLGLSYLPVGVGDALRAVVPILRRDAPNPVVPLVIPASRITPEMLKYADIVYLGYLSGLGPLRGPMFSASRFAIGGSYDEIIDRQTSEHYMAGSHLERDGANPSRDFALISIFPGVAGTHIVVIGGTRDAALTQAAEFATRPDTLAQLAGAANSKSGFDALLAVESLRDVGLRAQLIRAVPRGTTNWSGRRSQSFPDEDPSR